MIPKRLTFSLHISAVTLLSLPILLLLSLLSANTLATESAELAKPLRIAVAANFTPVMKKLLVDFTKQTGIEGQLINGASGAIYLQIKHGAPFDIFLSADVRRPAQLEQEGLIAANSRKTYALGQLAYYRHQQQPFTAKASLAQLLAESPTRFAIANPDIAPYGQAAKEVLTQLGLWSSYQGKLVKGHNVSQTFAQVRSKAVASGLVAHSQ